MNPWPIAGTLVGWVVVVLLALLILAVLAGAVYTVVYTIQFVREQHPILPAEPTPAVYGLAPVEPRTSAELERQVDAHAADRGRTRLI